MTASAEVHVVYGENVLQCSTYLIAGPAGALLVDPGSGYWDEEVVKGIRRAGFGCEDVSHVLLTHCHVDHARGAFRFRERGAKLVAAPHAAEVLCAGGHQVWYEYPEEVIPTEIDLVPGDGEVLKLAGLEVRVLHTPGHTPGCASFLVQVADGLSAFTGDLLGSDGHPGWAGSEGFSIEQSLRSLAKLLAAAPDRAYWGHGAVEGPACDWLRRGTDLGRGGLWRVQKEYHPDIRPPDRP